nr:immunoglobulin light chain junction region [Macaca mulatta]
CQQGYITPYSF